MHSLTLATFFGSFCPLRRAGVNSANSLTVGVVIEEVLRISQQKTENEEDRQLQIESQLTNQ